jgi:hypothetical protein
MKNPCITAPCAPAPTATGRFARLGKTASCLITWAMWYVRTPIGCELTASWTLRKKP